MERRKPYVAQEREMKRICEETVKKEKYNSKVKKDGLQEGDMEERGSMSKAEKMNWKK